MCLTWEGKNSVPVVLSVIELAGSAEGITKITFLPAAIVNVSPPPNKIELVFNVVLSFTVRSYQRQGQYT